MDVDVSGVEGPVTGAQSCHVSPSIQNQELSSAALLAGFPDRDFFFAGGAAFFGIAGSGGTPGGRAIPAGAPPPFRICFIIFCAAENLSTRAFTS
jgi:hypothetical protein